MRRVPLELPRQELGRWGAQDVVDLLDLIHLVLSREEREECDDLEADTACRKKVHLEVVVPIGQQALGGPVPARADVLCERLPRVDASTAAQVRELDLVVHQQQVLGLDVAVENAVAVHVVQGLQHFIHVVLDLLLGQVVASAFDGLVDIHVHELEDQRQAPCGLVIQHLVQLDDVGVPRQSAERLDLAEVVHLVDAVEVVLHALDGNMLACLDGLGLEHLRESALALFRDEPVLVHGSLIPLGTAPRGVGGGGRGK
mmetsp:Transcript_75967/g.245889  ORF Transcript_75967/g.245889 Transcript_75967/m.245889 type:complete len:257 (+) Transcript_75967:1021-1791(+)